MARGLPDWFTLSGVDIDTARYAWKYGLKSVLSDFEIGLDESYYIPTGNSFISKNSFKCEGVLTVFGNLTVIG